MRMLSPADPPREMIVKLADGNIGAVSVLLKVWEKAEQVHPRLEPAAVMLVLDDLEIRGERLWILYKYIFDRNLPKMLAFMLACSGRAISRGEMDAAIDGMKACEDLDARAKMYVDGWLEDWNWSI